MTVPGDEGSLRERKREREVGGKGFGVAWSQQQSHLSENHLLDF